LAFDNNCLIILVRKEYNASPETFAQLCFAPSTKVICTFYTIYSTIPPNRRENTDRNRGTYLTKVGFDIFLEVMRTMLILDRSCACIILDMIDDRTGHIGDHPIEHPTPFFLPPYTSHGLDTINIDEFHTELLFPCLPVSRKSDLGSFRLQCKRIAKIAAVYMVKTVYVIPIEKRLVNLYNLSSWPHLSKHVTEVVFGMCFSSSNYLMS
jgi:hypothetical protein